MTSTEPYRVLLAPDIQMSSADFVEAWNELENCRGQAEAILNRQAFDPGFSAAHAALVGVAAGVAASLIIELVKRALARADQKRCHQKSTEKVVTVKYENGLPIIRVQNGVFCTTPNLDGGVACISADTYFGVFYVDDPLASCLLSQVANLHPPWPCESF